MSSNNRNRRSAGGVGMAVGAAFTAALIGLANAPAARADTEPDPFEDLFGTAGGNTWTPSADSFLNSIDPTNALAGNFDTSVDNFLAQVGSNDPLGSLLYSFDPSAFSVDPTAGVLLPDNAIGDLATGLDYTLFNADQELIPIFELFLPVEPMAGF
jgi:hypothetical protein